MSKQPYMAEMPGDARLNSGPEIWKDVATYNKPNVIEGVFVIGTERGKKSGGNTIIQTKRNKWRPPYSRYGKWNNGHAC